MSEIEYTSWARNIRQLADCVRELEPVAREMKLRPLEQRAWNGPLFQHLRTEVSDDEPVIRVAITSGTNTGKSTVFNQLVGAAVSRTEKEATKTRHPVCIVPQGMFQPARLQELFPDFQVRPWKSEMDAVEPGADDILIVREDPEGHQSRRLMLLDTPDVDGVLKENWRRAELVRNAADVLIVTLTMQKYNDNEIIQFFRAAARSDKTFIIVFNFIDWPDDREVCRRWLQSFEQKTGTQAHFVYAVPFDPQAARELSLPFHPLTRGARDLETDLAELRFAEIKIRSLTGSLREVLDPETGVVTFLREVRTAAARYGKTRENLVRVVKSRPVRGPKLPQHIAWKPFAEWLESRNISWAVRIHAGYRWVWTKMTSWITGGQSKEEAERQFRDEEWECYSAALHQILDEIDRLREQGDHHTRDVLGPIPTGPERKALFDEIRKQYGALPLANEEFDQYVAEELDRLKEQRPAMIQSIEFGVVATAVVRPLITVGVFALPELGAQAAAEAATHAVQHAAADASVAVAIDAGAEGSSRFAFGQFLARIFAEYYRLRAVKLTAILEGQVIGPALHRAEQLAAAAELPALKRAEELAGELARELEKLPEATGVT